LWVSSGYQAEAKVKRKSDIKGKVVRKQIAATEGVNGINCRDRKEPIDRSQIEAESAATSVSWPRGEDKAKL